MSFSDLGELMAHRQLLPDVINQLEFMEVVKRTFLKGEKAVEVREEWRDVGRLAELKKYLQMFT